MMKKLILFLCLAIAFATAGLWVHSFLTVGVDGEIVRVLAALDCPWYCKAVDEAWFGDLAAVRASSLTLEESGESDGYAVEVYRGASGDCLALMRKDEKVYCAQYVNDKDAMRYADVGRFDKDVYVHHQTPSWTGIYLRADIAYFTDGTYVLLDWRTPTEKEPSVSRRTFGAIMPRLPSFRAERGMRLSDYAKIEVGRSTYRDLLNINPFAADSVICTSYGYFVPCEVEDGRISIQCVYEDGEFVIDEMTISRK